MEVKQVAAVPEGDLPLPRKTTSGGAALRFRHGNNLAALPGVCDVAPRVTAGKPTPHGPPHRTNTPGCSLPALTTPVAQISWFWKCLLEASATSALRPRVSQGSRPAASDSKESDWLTALSKGMGGG